MENNGNNIRVYAKLLRREKHLTLSKVASQLYLSVSKLSEYENGKIDLHPELEEKLCNILGFSSRSIMVNFIIDGSTLSEFYKRFVISMIFGNNVEYELIDLLENKKSLLVNYLEYPYYYLIKGSFMYIYKVENYQYYLSIIKSLLKNFTELDNYLFNLINCLDLYRDNKFKDCLDKLNKLDLIENTGPDNELLLLKDYLYILCFNSIGYIDTSAKLIESKINILNEKHNKKLIELLLIETSVIEGLKGNFKGALQISYSNLIQCINESNTQYLFAILNQLGYFHFCLKDYIKAITFFDYAILQKSPDSFKMSKSYFFVSLSYYYLNKFSECKNNLKKAKCLSHEIRYLNILISWLESMLNKSYSKKCENLLLDLFCSDSHSLNLEMRMFVLDLLKIHYYNTNNNHKINELKI